MVTLSYYKINYKVKQPDMNPGSLPFNNHNRAANLRQCLLRASRLINLKIVENIHHYGFTELKSTHTALLSNLDLEGSNLTIIALRAGMTKQAMGRLVDELINLNYVTRKRCKDDKRAVIIEFTPTGLELMNYSFAAMEEIESCCARRIGVERFEDFLISLQDIVDEFENIQK